MFIESENREIGLTIRMVNLEHMEAIWVEEETEIYNFNGDKAIYKTTYKVKARGISGADYNLAKYDTYEEAKAHLEAIQHYTQSVQIIL